MQFLQARLLATSFALLLTACGGGSVGVGIGGDVGDDDVDEFFHYPPRSSGRAGAVTISRATPEVRLDGVYSARDVQLSEVLRFRAGSDYPETCRFRFSNLQQESGQVSGIFGEVRYLPNSTVVRDVFLNVANQDFRQDGSAVTIDNATNQVVFNGLPFASLERTGQTFVMTGRIPIRTDLREVGC